MRHGNYQKYLNPNPLQRALIRHFLDVTAYLVASTGARTAVDAGCAEGFVSARLGETLPQLQVVGIDLDRAALGRGRHLHPGLPTCVGNILYLPFPDRSADVVLCTEVLEHLDDPGQALRELARVSRAYLLLSVPWEPWFRLANLARWKNLLRLGDDPEHVHHWTAGTFRHFLSSHVQVLVHRVAFPWQVVLAKVWG